MGWIKGDDEVGIGQGALMTKNGAGIGVFQGLPTHRAVFPVAPFTGRVPRRSLKPFAVGFNATVLTFVWFGGDIVTV